MKAPFTAALGLASPWKVLDVDFDETATRRGHDYITLFHDMDARRILFACPGRDQSTVATFIEDLRAHGGTPGQVEAVSIDMPKAYIASVARHLPEASAPFDRFQVIQLANQAVEQVRRRKAAWTPPLKGTRWSWLKNQADLTKKQLKRNRAMCRNRLEIARAWRIKEVLRELFATKPARKVAEAGRAAGLVQLGPALSARALQAACADDQGSLGGEGILNASPSTATSATASWKA